MKICQDVFHVMIIVTVHVTRTVTLPVLLLVTIIHAKQDVVEIPVQEIVLKGARYNAAVTVP
jgi:hypothetical protein